ncbi:hypothetical protein QA648_27545 (plasmid) [Rhizobium sp. CB3171]|uniref:hypothetical protein n=1 Tax=Rhizobium sp. CB3171 TaxID=3039157 RepID=UPI0024B0C02E|nr:hypothetical protein [Rhizobium sp. CB3171]WFU04537.1 hypothetical protein QA648_27545 [Rhizobium sp. CB3171]
MKLSLAVRGILLNDSHFNQGCSERYSMEDGIPTDSVNEHDVAPIFSSAEGARNWARISGKMPRAIAGMAMGSSVLFRHTYINDMHAFCLWSGCPLGGVTIATALVGTIEEMCKAQGTYINESR